jgi:tetratricopeptide (TPR) repeat protein
VHAAAKHGANAMQRGMLLQGALLVTALSTADSEYNNYIVGGAQLGAQLLSQRYGREAELEADYYGMQYMKRAGYDPRAAVSLQNTFVRLSEGHEQSWIEGLFSSHPPSRERVARNAATAEELGAGGDVAEARYRELMMPTLSARESYAQFDRALKQANAGAFEKALLDVNRAIEQLPTEARFYGLRGDIHLAQDKYQRAANEFSQAISRDANYFEYYLGRGLALSRLGKSLEARQDLERSNRLLPTAIASNELGELLLASGDSRAAKQYFEVAMTASGDIGKRAATSFARLDIPDNPARYIATGPIMTADQRLMGVVTNQTDFTLRDIQLEFQAIVNGSPITRTVSIRSIGPHQQGNVSAGWQFKEADIIESPRIVVRAASL